MTTSMVDWTVALNTATKLVKPGPEISREGAAAVVAELRSSRSEPRRTSPRSPEWKLASGTAPVLVVDRPRWIQANLDGFRQILAPLNAKAAESMKNSSPGDGQPRPLDHRRRGRARCSATSSPKVLGQFDPFFPGADAGAPGGRLLLVAPNIVAIERELERRARPTSGSGSACTRRLTESSSPPCRGCVDYLNDPDRADRRHGRPGSGDRWPRCCVTRSGVIIEGVSRIRRSPSSTWSRPRRSGRSSTGSRQSCRCSRVTRTS